ncbi:MAG TPA: hypothetical protein VEH86_05990 [Candidatus Acidoferrum sp.]|nr:hypothetical protein [Candidatus Acidoferrum sp.]
MKENTVKRKYCGNCGNHTVYNYPNQLFCSRRFQEDKNPLVDTLWCCEDWNPSSQECYCIKEATKKQT